MSECSEPVNLGAAGRAYLGRHALTSRTGRPGSA